MKKTPDKRFRNLSDAEIIDLMHTMGDDLPREVVTEALARGTRMIPYLYVIVSDKTSWTRPLPEWWASVHATYLLGAYETPETITALLSALRWADAFDCEWVTEDLPSMIGRLGQHAWAPVMAVARDQSAGWGARSIALGGLAAIALRVGALKEGFLDYAAYLLADSTEPVVLRQTAANALMDFRSKPHRKLLISFGKEESRRREEIPDYEGVFYEYEVDEFLNADEQTRDLEYYRRDWLVFYDPEERARRKEFWEEEQHALDQAIEESHKSAHGFEPDRYQSTCPCGSGKPYSECCIKKVH